MALKAAKAKIKARKSTPAPPTKGDGRKRYVLSPLPEDKQLRKRIDFGEEDCAPVVSPKCKNSIFPVLVSPNMEDALQEGENVQGGVEEEIEMGRPHVGRDATSDLVLFSGQDSVQVAGEETDDHDMEPSQPSHDKSIVLGAAKVQGALGEEMVNLPDKDMGTKMLLESRLVPCQNGESHDALAVSDYLQPNPTNLLHVASLDAADMLDTLAAQPLLNAGTAESGQPAAEPYHAPQFGMNFPLLSPSTAFKAYQTEFPPLEKGRTLKLRDSFERGRPKGAEMVPSPCSSQHALPYTHVKPGVGEGPTVSASMPEAPKIGASPSSSPTSGVMADLFKVTPSATMNGPQFSREEGAGVGSTGNLPANGAETDSVTTNAWRSMADLIKGAPDPNGPQVFVADKIFVWQQPFIFPESSKYFLTLQSSWDRSLFPCTNS